MSDPLRTIFIHWAFVQQVSTEAAALRATRQITRCFCHVCAMSLPQVQGFIRVFFLEVLILYHFIMFYACLLLKHCVVIALFKRFRTI